jgi:hypothetical protein
MVDRDKGRVAHLHPRREFATPRSGESSELANMFLKYQNSYVKHDDAVIAEEVEFIFELTPCS